MQPCLASTDWAHTANLKKYVSPILLGPIWILPSSLMRFSSCSFGPFSPLSRKQTRPIVTSPTISYLSFDWTSCSKRFAKSTCFNDTETHLSYLYFSLFKFIISLTCLIQSCSFWIPYNLRTNQIFKDLNRRPNGICQCYLQVKAFFLESYSYQYS